MEGDEYAIEDTYVAWYENIISSMDAPVRIISARDGDKVVGLLADEDPEPAAGPVALEAPPADFAAEDNEVADATEVEEEEDEEEAEGVLGEAAADAAAALPGVAVAVVESFADDDLMPGLLSGENTLHKKKQSTESNTYIKYMLIRVHQCRLSFPGIGGKKL